jgi:hypothetical protein
MSLVLEIPDEAVQAMDLPAAEVEAELKKEESAPQNRRRQWMRLFGGNKGLRLGLGRFGNQ